MVLAVTGDSIGPYEAVTPNDPRLAEVAKLIRAADAGFGNQEGSVFDLKTFNGSLGAENGGGTPLVPAAVAGEFRALGLTLMSKANNHAVDYWLEGLAASEKALDAAGVAHAGSGAAQSPARAPACLATAHGRVALIATASTYPDMAAAGPPSERDGVQLPGRPGISVLRTRQTVLVTPAEMAALRTLAARRIGQSEPPGGAQLNVQDLHSGSQSYRIADPPGLHYDVEAADRDALLATIHDVRPAARLVVFSIHAHESTSLAPDNATPADFLPVLFHSIIDAGADVVVRHGPHALGGVEIYKGKPIFYGMASFFNGLGAPDRMFRGHLLAESWDDGLVAVTRFKGSQLSSVQLYPIRTIREPGPMLGAPRRAPPADALRILQQLQRNSAAYGTTIEIHDGVGLIRGPAG
jgi:poly-gamma-glutamate synthesis protein (capsule biosynthesis protein)